MTVGQQLRDLLQDLYAAFGSGDATAWTDHVAQDVVFLGSDADEWWQGRQVFTQVVTAQMKEISDSGAQLLLGDPQVFEQGAVAWVVDRPILRLQSGDEVPLRVTLVADVSSGRLQLRHGHFSVGVRNEEVFDQGLTTR